jgi:hypothetical protein
MPLFTDTTSNTVHELDPAKFGAVLLEQLIAEGLLVKGDQTGEAKPRARKAAAPKAAEPVAAAPVETDED